MPYYCSVPHCTSLGGRVKNVSFHKFPRDEELAKLWNQILKRNKPYTKYSKVCSLHFTEEDYTLASASACKGSWRSLKKDAIPSRNLPGDTSKPKRRRRHMKTPYRTPITDQQIQQAQQMAIYQTMLAMQAAGAKDAVDDPADTESQIESPKAPSESTSGNSTPTQQNTTILTLSDIEQLLRNSQSTNVCKEKVLVNSQNINTNDADDSYTSTAKIDKIYADFGANIEIRSYKCKECSKCFKDPDIFLLHNRMHAKSPEVEDRPTEIQERMPVQMQEIATEPVQERLPAEIQESMLVEERIPAQIQEEMFMKIQERTPAEIQERLPAEFQERMPAEMQESLPDNASSYNVNDKENNLGKPGHEILKANPILANLLRTGNNIQNDGANENVENGVDANNLLHVENSIIAALAANMEAYIKNISSMMSNKDDLQPAGDQNTSDLNDACDKSLEETDSNSLVINKSL